MALESQIRSDEQMLWCGTKNKKVSVLEAIFNPMLPVAVLWGMIDFAFIGMASGASRAGAGVTSFLVPFFLLHLMPVWLYLGGVLTSAVRAKNTYYIVTDKAVYIQHGVLQTTEERIPYNRVLSVGTQQSFFDKREFTGDVVLKLDELVYTGKRNTPHQREIKIENIPDYEELYQTIIEYQQLFVGGTSEYAPQDMRSFPQQPLPQYGNPQYGAPQAPQYGNPPYGAPQAPQYGNPQYGSPQAPQYGNPQYGAPQYGNPQYGSPQAPQYGNPQYGSPQVPQYGNPQYGAPQAPQYGNPQYGAPQAPQYGDPQYGAPQDPQYGEQPDDRRW